MSENVHTSHSIFVISKCRCRVVRHGNVIFRRLLMLTACTPLVQLPASLVSSELPVTFLVDLLLVCQWILRCCCVSRFIKNTWLCVILTWPHNYECRQHFLKQPCTRCMESECHIKSDLLHFIYVHVHIGIWNGVSFRWHYYLMSVVVCLLLYHVWS